MSHHGSEPLDGMPEDPERKLARMTPEQKHLLRKHGEHFQQMASYVHERDPEELDDLYRACKAADQCNIGWDCWEAAQFLIREIEQLQRYRHRLAVENANPVPRPDRVGDRNEA